MSRRGVAGQRSTAATSACARVRRSFCRLVLAGAFCLVGWAALAAVDTGSAAASEHSAGGVEVGRDAGRGGLLATVFGADTDRATTGVEARGPARQDAEPARPATDRPDTSGTSGALDATAPVSDTVASLDGDAPADESTGAPNAPAVATPVKDTLTALGSSGTAPAGAEVEGLVAPFGIAAPDADAPDGPAAATAPAGGVVEGLGVPLGTDAPGADAPGAEAPAPGTTAPGADAPGADAPGITTPGADAPGTTAPGADAPGATAPGADALGAALAGGVVEGLVAPFGTTTPGADAAGQFDPFGGMPTSGSEWAEQAGAHWNEAAAPIGAFFDRLKSAAKAWPKPGEPWLPGVDPLVPGQDPEDDAPAAPDGQQPSGAAGHSAGSTEVTPTAPGIEVLPTVPSQNGSGIGELAPGASGVQGAAETPADEPALPQGGELPGTVGVGSVATTSNGGAAGGGPAAQTTERVGAGAEPGPLGIARASDHRALSNDGDKPPVSPD